MKDEANGKIFKKFIGTKWKMYVIKVGQKWLICQKKLKLYS